MSERKVVSFKVKRATTEDGLNVAKLLEKASSEPSMGKQDGVGWCTQKHAGWSQEIEIEFDASHRIEGVQLVSHAFRIPKVVKVSATGPGPDKSPLGVGSIHFDSNLFNNFSACEEATVMFPTPVYGTGLVFEIEGCYRNPRNIFQQAHIISLTCYGESFPGVEDQAPAFLPERVDETVGGQPVREVESGHLPSVDTQLPTYEVVVDCRCTFECDHGTLTEVDLALLSVGIPMDLVSSSAASSRICRHSATYVRRLEEMYENATRLRATPLDAQAAERLRGVITSLVDSGVILAKLEQEHGILLENSQDKEADLMRMRCSTLLNEIRQKYDEEVAMWKKEEAPHQDLSLSKSQSLAVEMGPNSSQSHEEGSPRKASARSEAPADSFPEPVTPHAALTSRIERALEKLGLGDEICDVREDELPLDFLKYFGKRAASALVSPEARCRTNAVKAIIECHEAPGEVPENVWSRLVQSQMDKDIAPDGRKVAIQLVTTISDSVKSDNLWSDIMDAFCGDAWHGTHDDTNPALSVVDDIAASKLALTKAQVLRRLLRAHRDNRVPKDAQLDYLHQCLESSESGSADLNADLARQVRSIASLAEDSLQKERLIALLDDLGLDRHREEPLVETVSPGRSPRGLSSEAGHLEEEVPVAHEEAATKESFGQEPKSESETAPNDGGQEEASPFIETRGAAKAPRTFSPSRDNHAPAPEAKGKDAKEGKNQEQEESKACTVQ